MVRLRNVKPKSSSNQETAIPSMLATVTVLSNIVLEPGTSTAPTQAGVSGQNNDAGILQMPYQGYLKNCNDGSDLIPPCEKSLPVLDVTDGDFTSASHQAGNNFQANRDIVAPLSYDKWATNSNCSSGVKSQGSRLSLRSFLASTPISPLGEDDDDDFVEPAPKTPRLSSSSKKGQKVSQPAARSSKKRASLSKSKPEGEATPSNSGSTRAKKSPKKVERGLLETLLTAPIAEFPRLGNDNVVGPESVDLSGIDRENGIVGQNVVAISVDNPAPLQMSTCNEAVLPAAPLPPQRGIGVGVKGIHYSDVSDDDGETESIDFSQDSDYQAVQTVRHLIKNLKRKRDEASSTVNDCNEKLRNVEEEWEHYMAKLRELEFRMGDLREKSAKAQAVVDSADKKLTAIQGRLGL